MRPGLTARPPFPWVGGKEQLQYIIRSIFPPNPPRYAEHFGGSGSILLGLPMSLSRMEVYNDYDSDLTTYSSVSGIEPWSCSVSWASSRCTRRKNFCCC